MGLGAFVYHMQATIHANVYNTYQGEVRKNMHILQLQIQTTNQSSAINVLYLCERNKLHSLKQTASTNAQLPGGTLSLKCFRNCVSD